MGALTIFTDGGSRGNPGLAASAFVVIDNEKIIYKGSRFLGTATNNVAEYTGVLIALEWLKENKLPKNLESINFVLDSELVVRQLNKVYRVKNPEIKKVYDIVIEKISSLPYKFSFTSVSRDKNKEADRLVNETLDNNI